MSQRLHGRQLVMPCLLAPRMRMPAHVPGRFHWRAGSAPPGLRQLPKRGAASNDVKRQLLYKQNEDCRFADGDSRVSGGCRPALGWHLHVPPMGHASRAMRARAHAQKHMLLQPCHPATCHPATHAAATLPPAAGTVYMAGAVHKQLLNEAYQMFRQGCGPASVLSCVHGCLGASRAWHGWAHGGADLRTMSTHRAHPCGSVSNVMHSLMCPPPAACAPLQLCPSHHAHAAASPTPCTRTCSQACARWRGRWWP